MITWNYRIIFFDIKNGFKYIADIKGIKPYFNSQIFTLIHSNKILIVAVEGGFELINLNNFSKIKSVHSKSSDSSEIKTKRTVATLGLRIKKKGKKERAGTQISVKQLVFYCSGLLE